MKTFLKKLLRFVGIVYLCYLLVITALCLIFIHALPNFHADTGTFSKEYTSAFKNKDADMLIVGSSRAAASLSAKVISDSLDLSAYNLAFNQSSLTYAHHLLKYYLDDTEQTPKYVVLDISWFSFDNNRLAYKEYGSYFVFNRPLLFYDDLLLNKRNQIFNGFITLARSMERINQDYADFDTKISETKNQDSTKVTYVFDPDDVGFLRTFPNYKAKLIEDEKASFESIITLLESNDITLVLYTSPEDYKFSQSQKNRDEVYNYIKSVSRDVYWLDYSLGGAKYAKAYENLLKDSHHIFYKEHFSKRFSADFKALVGIQ